MHSYEIGILRQLINLVAKTDSNKKPLLIAEQRPSLLARHGLVGAMLTLRCG